MTEKRAVKNDTGLGGHGVNSRAPSDQTRNIRPWVAESPEREVGVKSDPPDGPGPPSREGPQARPGLRSFGDTTPSGGTRALSPRRGRVKILFVEANALHERPLQLNREYTDIKARLRASRHREVFELLPPCLAASAASLQSALLEHEPHIVHFAGHGGEGAELMLLDERDRPAPISAKALGALFRALGGGVRLVVFNACFSDEQAAAVGEVVGLAVGMKGEVGDKAARGFAAAFYEALGYGRSVKAAFELGVTTVKAAPPSQEAAPRLVERPGVNAAGLSFVAPLPWRRLASALALASSLALASALTLGRGALPRSPAPSPAKAASPSSALVRGPRPEHGATAALEGARPGRGAMVAIQGARIEIGAIDRATAPPECDGAGDDCGVTACPGRGRSVEVAGFLLDVTEVTNEDFARWLEGRKDDWHLAKGGSGVVLTNANPPVPLVLASEECGGLIVEAGMVRARTGSERRPVLCVTWQGANDYCRARGKRLPSSAEWELAAKGPQGRPFPWGVGRPTSAGIAFGGEAATLDGPREVASSTLDRTPEGVFDLGGNVAEWVGDGNSAGLMALRGGSWHSASACNLLSSGTALRPAKTYGKDVGFRCARNAP